jgi:negative regulator of flagellin synthesis FlgM
MVIDFSRLNNSPSVTGGVRGNAAPAASKTGSQPGSGESTSASGEAVHLSHEAQQLQKISDKLRDQPPSTAPVWPS